MRLRFQQWAAIGLTVFAVFCGSMRIPHPHYARDRWVLYITKGTYEVGYIYGSIHFGSIRREYRPYHEEWYDYRISARPAANVTRIG